MPLEEFEAKLRQLYGQDLYTWHRHTDEGIMRVYYDEPECMVAIGSYLNENNFKIGPNTIYY